MCTSFVRNAKKTIAGFNLDILGMEHRVSASENGVFMEIHDASFGWLPLFGVNSRGDFVGMPTCHPYDARSEQSHAGQVSVLQADIDLLIGNKTFEEVHRLAEAGEICSNPQVTFQMQISDRQGNVLRHTPGQGCEYLEKPKFAVMTNFSPWKGNSESHPWMGWDRYQKAVEMLESRGEDFGVGEGFEVLKATAQTVCPTVVSIVYDAQEHAAYWCEERRWEEIHAQKLSRFSDTPSA